jgi:hypothetical protein
MSLKLETVLNFRSIKPYSKKSHLTAFQTTPALLLTILIYEPLLQGHIPSNFMEKWVESLLHQGSN